MNREQAKELFRNDKDAYGKPKSIMKKLDLIFDEFEQSNEIKIKLPKGYMNCGIGKTYDGFDNNVFISDTNDSQNWDEFSVQLPPGNWAIYKITLGEVLIRKIRN